jgi:hypothetical protein
MCENFWTLPVFLGLRGEFACKKCCGGIYACQVASGKAARSKLQAKRLQTFLVGYPLADDNKRIPDKPLWWRWPSYDRLGSKLAQYQAKGTRRGGRPSKRITERMTRPLWDYGIRSERD